MDWTVPGLRARKSKFAGFEFPDGSTWMMGSAEPPGAGREIAYKIYRREDGSTFKRSFNHRYSKDRNNK